jgi:hypothetical protein
MTKRELVQRASGWGCSACGWLFMPPGSAPKTISPLMSAGTALHLEFAAHDCAAFPVADNVSSLTG